MNKKNLLLSVIIFILIGVAIGLGVYYVQQTQQSQDTRSQAAPATTMQAVAPSPDPTVGDQFLVLLQIDNSGENLLAGGEIYIEFDPMYLQVVEAEAVVDHSYFPGANVLTPDIDNQTGSIHYTTFLPPQAYSNQPELKAAGYNDFISIRFEAVAPTDSTTVELTEESVLVAFGENNIDVLTSASPASFAVLADTSTAVTPSPTIDPFETGTPSPTIDPFGTAPTATPSGTFGTGGTAGTVTPTPTTYDGGFGTGTGSTSGTGGASGTGSSSTGTTNISSPTSGSSTTDTTPTISGTAPSNATVYVNFENGLSSSTTADSSGNWSWTPTSVLTGGSHTVTITNSVNTDSDAVSFTVTTGTGATALPDSGSFELTLILSILGVLVVGSGLALLK